MVVVGPKDSGKSEGIKVMKMKWKDIGHIVINLNLKGKPQNVNSKHAMDMISKELMQELQILNYNVHLHVHKCVPDVYHKDMNVQARIIKWSSSNFKHE